MLSFILRARRLKFSSLLNHPELPPRLDERPRRKVNVLLCVRGGYLRAYPRLTLGDDGEGESDDKQALQQKRICHLGGQTCIAEEDGADRVASGAEDGEARCAHGVAKAVRQLPHLFNVRVVVREHLRVK